MTDNLLLKGFARLFLLIRRLKDIHNIKLKLRFVDFYSKRKVVVVRQLPFAFLGECGASPVFSSGFLLLQILDKLLRVTCNDNLFISRNKDDLDL